MECNKDEAARAKEIAEKKFTDQDISGAKKFALKAQNLFPGLEGLPQFLATLDVYISAEKKINEDVDWYEVLGVDPLADDDTVRKHYRKLALILHPDKNKSVGADGAFKIISEAWSLLSDKVKRIAYDQKRNLRNIHQKVPTRNPLMSAGKNGFHNIPNGNNSKARDQKSGTRPQPVPAPPRPSKPNTFWTACNSCKMQYEYLRNYLNHTLLCPNCHTAFLAVEMPAPPSNGGKSSTPWSSFLKQQNRHTTKNSSTQGRKPASAPNLGPAGFSGVDSFNHANFQRGPSSKSGRVENATASASSAAQAACVVQPACEKLKRGHEEAQMASKREEALRRKIHASKKTGAGLATGSNAGSSSVLKGERPSKKRHIDERRMSSNIIEMVNQMAMANGGVGMGSASGFQKGNFRTEKVSGSNRPNSTKELSQLEIRNLLMVKARMEIGKKLDEWSMDAVSKTTHKGEREEEKEKQKAAINDGNKYSKSMDTKKRVHTRRPAPIISDVDSDTKATVPMSINVPDPDFHDFDEDRTEKSFGVNQVWAAYDDDDGMPRYYALIHSVISLKPFKMRISWLNSKSNNELAPLNWIGSGFSKTSGDFRIGKYEVNNSLNSFSHKVKWEKGTRGAIQIYPRKGDVWALYRNWSRDWNELTPDEVIHRYDMVEVLEDYTEERGVTVAPLVKVAGFKTVFHQHLDPREARMIPRGEIFRFSHQVPSYLLTGQEAQNAPKGCRELDPAATPLELLQVITEVKEELDSSGKAKEEAVLGDVKKNEEELVEDSKTTEETGMINNGKKVGANDADCGENQGRRDGAIYQRRQGRNKAGGCGVISSGKEETRLEGADC